MAVVSGARLSLSTDHVHVLLPSLPVFMMTLVGAISFYLLTRQTRSSGTDENPKSKAKSKAKMPPDTVSTLFPDRPIRPLPKRRIRERLSPEAAESIKYPLPSHENAPLFCYPYALRHDGSPQSDTSDSVNSRRNETGRSYPEPRRPDAVRSDAEEDEALRSTVVTRSPPEIVTRRVGRRPNWNQPYIQPRQQPNPQPPPSTTSSTDGYDSFENANNKKKRKIPTAGDSLLAGAHLVNGQVASMAASPRAHSTANAPNGERPASQPSASPGAGSFLTGNQGISGSGRGRLGRPRNGRSPLRTVPDGANSWSGRGAKNAFSWAPAEPPGQEAGGIISNAIANASKLQPFSEQKIKENIKSTSLIKQYHKPTPASAQFTFTCDSQVPGTIQWPSLPTKHNMATQTPNVAAPASKSTAAPVPDAATKASQAKKERRQTRRELEKELRVAARQRRRLAADSYFSNPPKSEDIWICELCEYERIFGEPPKALIRRYEMKDRKQRQEELDRKRLLEKAKAKSRKGKKSGKLPAKGGQPATETPLAPPSDPLPPPSSPEVGRAPKLTEGQDEGLNQGANIPGPKDARRGVGGGGGGDASSARETARLADSLCDLN